MRRNATVAMELDEARSSGLHNIGEAARASGVSAKMIRHYEAIGLIPKAGRTFAGYRLYSDNDVHVLRFVKRARSLGFGIHQIETLLRLWRDRSRASRDVKRIPLAHAAELEERIRELVAMKRTLEDLARHCHGDHRPECPILDDLARPGETNAERPVRAARAFAAKRRPRHA